MQVMYTKSIHHFFLLSQILLDVYLMYTKNVHHGNVIHTVYTICLQKVYYQCSNFGKGSCACSQERERERERERSEHSDYAEALHGF